MGLWYSPLLYQLKTRVSSRAYQFIIQCLESFVGLAPARSRGRCREFLAREIRMFPKRKRPHRVADELINVSLVSLGAVVAIKPNVHFHQQGRRPFVIEVREVSIKTRLDIIYCCWRTTHPVMGSRAKEGTAAKADTNSKPTMVTDTRGASLINCAIYFAC